MKSIIYSLRYRIAATILLLELIMISVVLWASLSFFQGQTEKQFQKSEQVILNMLADISGVALLAAQYDDLQGYVNTLVTVPQVKKIHVTNTDRLIVVSTDFDEIGAVEPVLVNTDSSFWRRREIESLGGIAIAFSNEQLAVARDSAKRFGFVIALAGVSVIALVGLFTGYWLTRRLTILTTAAHSFERGDSSVHVEFSGKDEIAQLGDTFVRMRGKIDRYIEALRQERAELKASRDELEQRVEQRTAELSQLNEKLQKLSEFDELTQVFNRRKFNEIMQSECAAANRHQSALAVALIDIDCFKAYNDHYGHRRGDEVLSRVAGCLNSTLKRHCDSLARYGGEEFVAVLPATDRQGAEMLAEELRAAVDAMGIPHGASQVSDHVTICVGVAVSPPLQKSKIDPDVLFEYADKALYEAKSAGRNQVRVAQASDHQ